MLFANRAAERHAYGALALGRDFAEIAYAIRMGTVGHLQSPSRTNDCTSAAAVLRPRASSLGNIPTICAMIGSGMYGVTAGLAAIAACCAIASAAVVILIPLLRLPALMLVMRHYVARFHLRPLHQAADFLDRQISALVDIENIPLGKSLKAIADAADFRCMDADEFSKLRIVSQFEALAKRVNQFPRQVFREL
jgi:hypothetical protein